MHDHTDHGTDVNEFNEVDRDLALRALVMSSQEQAGVRIVRGTMAGLPFPWLLDVAVATIRAGRDAGIAGIVWDSTDDQDRRLVVLDVDGREAYRFATVNPFEMPQIGPPSGVPRRRAAVWIVPPPDADHEEPRASA